MVRRAVKVRIYPDDEQAAFLHAQFGAVRFAYNTALWIKQHKYRYHNQSLSVIHDLKPLLAVAKDSRKYHWLSQYDSMALQQAIRNLNTAYQNFFNPKLKARFPKRKRKYAEQSSYHCTNLVVTADSIKIPKLSPITAKIHRKLDGVVKSITISRKTNGKHYASILLEDGQVMPDKPTVIERVVAGDLGLTDYLVLNDGTRIPNPRFLKAALKNLANKQRRLSRKKKGSHNRAKARQTLAAAHQRVANARADFQHKLARLLVDENQAIIVETLRVSNMLKSRKLARAISDAGWGGFIRKMADKAERAGVHLVKADQWFASSKRCHCCKHTLAGLPLSVRHWTCPVCHAEHDRDINAAFNLLLYGIEVLHAAGLAVLAHGALHQPVRETVVEL